MSEDQVPGAQLHCFHKRQAIFVSEGGNNSLIGEAAAVDAPRHTVTLHPGRRVHRVSEQTVARHLVAHHARHHRPAVDPHPDLK